MKSFFISSTFRDMQEERDVIHRKVFPAIRNKLKKFGETAEDMDLRWGVDTLNLTEEQSGNMVIRVCIDAIDRCVPYFIVLLGERYGWIPDVSAIQNIHDTRVKKISKNISITEMEIQYGALLRDAGMEQCIFCFRNESLIDQIPEEFRKDYAAESQEHKEKLDNLKKRIRNTEGVNILEYEAEWDEKNHKVCGLDAFAEQLEQWMMELLQKEGLSEERMSEEERIDRNADFTMKQYLTTYVNRQKIEAMFPILYADTRNVWICGKAGIGKTAFLSFEADQCRQKNILSCIYYGGNLGCGSVDVFLRWLAYKLETICGKKLKTENQTRRLSVKKIQNLSQMLTDTLYVFVDAIDEMSKDTLWVLIQLFETTSKLRFIVTNRELVPDLETQYGSNPFVSRKMDLLTDTELKMIVSKVAGKRGKTLDVGVMKQLCKKECMHLPINLSLLLQRLFMMDSMEFQQAENLAPGMKGISMYQQNLIRSSGTTSEELVTMVVNKAVDIMQLEGGENVSEILGYIAAAPEGLSVCTLSWLCPKTTKLQIQQLLCFLYDILEETEDGRWVYKHPVYQECICKRIGDVKMLLFKEKLYQCFSESREFAWKEFIRLGVELKKEEIAEEIASAVEIGYITEEQVWDLMRDESEKDHYYIQLAGKTGNEQYIRILLRAIAIGELDWSKEMASFIKDADERRFLEKETLFYFYGAKRNLCEFHYLTEQEITYAEKQYQIYTQMEQVSNEMLSEMIDLSVHGCSGNDVQSSKIWCQRLGETEEKFSQAFHGTGQWLQTAHLWYQKFIKYKETGVEADLAELDKLFEAKYTISSVMDHLNLYEQENPGYNEKSMELIAVFARNLTRLYLKCKNFKNAYSYAQIAYQESKKAYQLNRTYKTADIYSWNSMNLMRCLKQGSDLKKKYVDEALGALCWMESRYFCPKVGENQRYLYGEKGEKEKALNIVLRLCEEFPEGNYEDSVLYECREYKDELRSANEHQHFNQIIEVLSEMEKSGKCLFEHSGDGYYLDILHDWAINMMQVYMNLEIFEKAEIYLCRAEEYLKCDYIQKGKMRWRREIDTAVNGIALYYRKGDKEKAEFYMQKAEALFSDEMEKNKNESRKKIALRWEGRILLMRARILWEKSKASSVVRGMLENYFEKYTNPSDEKEQIPAHLLLGELEVVDGNTRKAVAEWETVWMQGNKYLEYELSEDEIWQYIMAARASLLIYDVSKEPKYLSNGMHAFLHIIALYTKDQNAVYRKTAGAYLAEYFIKYREWIPDHYTEMQVAEKLLIWLEYLAKIRPLNKKEKALMGECLIYRAKIDPKERWEEADKVYEWMQCQRQTESDDLRWNDRINRVLMYKALQNCLNEEYAEGMNVCQKILDGGCAVWNRERDVLFTVCKIQNGAEMAQTEIVDAYITEMETKDELEENEFWLYIETLIAAGICSLETWKRVKYFRKAAKRLERVLKKNNEKELLKLWKKDFVLREQCLEHSRKHANWSLYIEDLNVVRTAFAATSGNDKESIAKLLEYDGSIARAYADMGQEWKEWERWNTIMGIVNAFLLEKKQLDTEELEELMLFYQNLREKLLNLSSYEFYWLEMFHKLGYTSSIQLYEQIGELRWLEKALEVTETFRTCINRLKLNENRDDFREEKIAESYQYDMEIYQMYLENSRDEQVIERIVNTGKIWTNCIPKYDVSVRMEAIRIFQTFDEILEGRSLDIKALLQMLQMNRGENIFWIVKEAIEKYGTDFSQEELQELFRREQEK